MKAQVITSGCIMITNFIIKAHRTAYFIFNYKNSEQYFRGMIYKRLTSLIVFLVAVAMGAMAQMSDSQIVDYVKTQSSAGKDQKTIAKELLSRGVTLQQLERLKSKYAGGGSQQTATRETDIVERTRVANGEHLDDFSFPEEMLEPEDTIKIFGHDIFRSRNLTFEPQMNIATPANYALGPGDEVVLDIYGASQYSGSFKVAPDGSITIPNEGPVNVAGLTVQQAQARVARTIGAHYQNSTIKLSVGQTRTIMVNVMGEVKTPGTYTLSAFSTVFNALYMAGGINKIGTLREIKVSRNGRIISKVDVYDYIINGRLTGNVMLRDNDVIIVGPYENLVKIEGRIKRPMYYEMKKTESLQSLLNYAGGFTGDAFRQKVRVERTSEDGITVHNIDEWDFNAFRLADGDVAVVDSALNRQRNTVRITGAVFRPGYYKFGEKVNSVKTLIEQAGGLLEQAVTSRAVLRRVKADRTQSTMTINLAAIMNGTSPDVVLQNEDQLLISSTKELTDRYSLSIFGEVFHPGEYAYADGETVEDLITEAGGLLESASLQNVEVARRIVSSDDNPDGSKMATIYNLTLKDGLVIEGETGFRLRPYDIVTIHNNPDYQEQRRVYVTGEVKYSGSYILANKEERLTDVLKRAGGLTSKAYTGGVQLIRRVSEKERELQIQKLEVTTSQKDSVEILNNLQKLSYHIGIDLQKALANPGSSSDIVLMENDSIYIPQLNNTVKISGEVLFPNTVAYEEGRSASYYLNQAGGISRNSKRSLAYIVYANGQVSKLNKGDIRPGCEIVLPTKPEKKFDSTKTSVILAAASTIATIAAVLISAMK